MRTVKFVTMLVVCLVLVGFSGKAIALPGWAFSDGFEGVPGAVLPSAADLDPDLTIWNWADTWESYASSQTGIQVGNGPFAADEGNNFVKIGDSKIQYDIDSTYYFLERSWGNNNPAPQNAISNLAEDFTWEFSMRVDTDGGIGRVFLGKRTGLGTTQIQQALGIGIVNGRLKTYFHDAPQDVQAVSINTWYDIRVEADWDTQTFDLFLDGSPIGNHAFNYDYSSDIVNSMHAVNWSGYGNAGAGNLYLDDVSLTPEPATIALLLFGLPLLRKRK